MPRTRAAAPAERGHGEVWVLEISLRDEFGGGGVDGWVAEDGEVVWDYGCSFGDEIAVVGVVFC